MKKIVFSALTWLALCGVAFAQANVPGSALSYSGSPPTTLAAKTVPFTDVGLSGNDVTNEGALLVTALQKAVTGGYTLVGSPNMKFNAGTTGITLPGDASVNWNGATIDCSNMAASQQCITMQGSSSYSGTATVTTRPGQSGLIVSCGATASTTINGIIFQTLNNISFRDFAVYNCATNVNFGSNAYIIDFWNLRSTAATVTDVDMGSGSSMGEKISFHGGCFCNASSATGSAFAFYEHTVNEEAFLYAVSIDYNNNYVNITSGVLNMFGCHFEGPANLASQNVPFVTVARLSGFATYNGWGNTFADIGWQSVQPYDEPFGGRAALVSVTNSNQNKVSLHDSIWSGGQVITGYPGVFGAFDSTLIQVQSLSGVGVVAQISSDGLQFYNGSAGSSLMTDSAPHMGVLSPLYTAGYLASTQVSGTNATNLNGWLNDGEVNLLKNSGFNGTVAGSAAWGSAAGTAPTSGWVTSLNGAFAQYQGVNYASGRPELQLRLTSTSVTGAGYIQLAANTDINAQRYDIYQFYVCVRLIAVGPNNTATITNSNGNLTIAPGFYEKSSGGANTTTSGAGTAVNLTTNPTCISYTRTLNSNNGTTAYVAPYLIFGGSEFTATNGVDFTIGISAPEFGVVNQSVTDGPNQVTLGTAQGTSCRMGVDTSNTTNVTTFNGQANVLHMVCASGNASIFDPYYLSLPVKPGQSVVASAWVNTGPNYVSGSAGLYYEADDQQGNVISSQSGSVSPNGYVTGNLWNATAVGPGVTGNQAYNTTGTSASTVPGCNSACTVTYTPGTGTFVAGQTVGMTTGAASGVIPANDTVASITDSTHFVLTTPPTTALSGAGITAIGGITYTGQTGTFAVNQLVGVTSLAATGVIPTGCYIVSVQDSSHFTMVNTPLTALNNASITALNVINYTAGSGTPALKDTIVTTSGSGVYPSGDQITGITGSQLTLMGPWTTAPGGSDTISSWYKETAGTIRVPLGASVLRFRPYSSSLVGDMFIANLEATVQ